MTETGKWVFKNRGWLPVPILVLAIFFPGYDHSKLIIISGILLVIMGESGRLWSVGFAGGITRTRKGDLHELIVTGPFAVVRNPIYISNMIIVVIIVTIIVIILIIRRTKIILK